MIVNEFKKLTRHEPPDEGFFIPLLKWISGNEEDIELTQEINKGVEGGVPTPVLNRQLALNTKVKYMFKYPKVAKEDEKTKFFYKDICRYFDWTPKELSHNINILNLEELKPKIAQAYGYDNFQRRAIKLKPLKGFKRFECI